MFGYLVELEVNFSTIGIGQALDNPLDDLLARISGVSLLFSELLDCQRKRRLQL
jgi:hypothetical protein